MIDSGSKYSKKREAILEAMKNAKNHPGAHWVYEELKVLIPDLSLATVYRNIKFFLQKGKLASVGVVNGEERFDGIVEPHPHCICTVCGRVEDISCLSGEALKPLLRIPEGQTDFIIDYRKTLFSGICGKCSLK